ncbi:hypothetical protein [Caenispirillum salinarum]|uniref:hypothetical protein n=1 Tax=Caenispirillum salinarum TaxID=859058 RepID=UPI00384ED712
MVPALTSAPGEPHPHEQVDRFWRGIAEGTAAYLRTGHALSALEAGTRAAAAVTAVRAGCGGLPDREHALAEALELALDDLTGPEAPLSAGTGPRHRPRPPGLPARGLTMAKQPLRPVILAPSPRDQAMRLWSMVAATLLVPGLAAALALI